MKATRQIATIGALVLTAAMTGSAACPDYAKLDATMGTSTSLPEGWTAFGYEQQSGLYKSSVANFNPSLIPNTNNYDPRSIDISVDGEWLVFVDYQRGDLWGNVVIIRPDGQNRTTVPVQGNPRVVGFIHNGPNGDEIYYLPYKLVGSPTLMAIKVNLPTSGNPTFGDTRTLADIGPNNLFWPFGSGLRTVVVGDKIFGLLKQTIDGNQVARNGFITIPDSGLGTAGPDNIFQWANDTILEDMWGCGHTASWDGQLFAANSGNTGSGECVPNKKSYEPMDHKGIYITPFFKDSDTPIDFHDQIDRYGVSSNWCPLQYQFGAYNEVDFTYWAFSNHPYYLIGTLQGDLAPDHSLWVLHWPTNTWTRLTPENDKSHTYIKPVMFFPNADNIRTRSSASKAAVQSRSMLTLTSPQPHVVSVPSTATGFTVYSARGQKLWHYRSDAARGAVVSLPGSLNQAGLLVIRFQQ